MIAKEQRSEQTKFRRNKQIIEKRNENKIHYVLMKTIENKTKKRQRNHERNNRKKVRLS